MKLCCRQLAWEYNIRKWLSAGAGWHPLNAAVSVLPMPMPQEDWKRKCSIVHCGRNKRIQSQIPIEKNSFPDNFVNYMLLENSGAGSLTALKLLLPDWINDTEETTSRVFMI